MHGAFDVYLCIKILFMIVSGLIWELNFFSLCITWSHWGASQFQYQVSKSAFTAAPSEQRTIETHLLRDALKRGMMEGRGLLLKQRESYWYSLSYNFSQALIIYGEMSYSASQHSLLHDKHQRNVIQEMMQWKSSERIGLEIQVLLLPSCKLTSLVLRFQLCRTWNKNKNQRRKSM